MQVWGECHRSPGQRDPLGGDVCADRTRNLPCKLLGNLLKGIENAFDGEGTPANIRARAGCCLLRTLPSGVHFLLCWGSQGAGPYRPPQPGSRRSSVPCSTQSAKASLTGFCWVPGLLSAAPPPPPSDTRHQSRTASSFPLFVPDTGASETAPFIRGCAL